jgi:hypothetical protein
LSVRWAQVLLLFAVGLLAGIVAAVPPARRGGVLPAITHA